MGARDLFKFEVNVKKPASTLSWDFRVRTHTHTHTHSETHTHTETHKFKQDFAVQDTRHTHARIHTQRPSGLM